MFCHLDALGIWHFCIWARKLEDGKTKRLRFWTVVAIRLLLSFSVGLVPNALAAGGRSTPATGCGGLGAMPTTWPASPASLARGSCPPGKSLAWWRRRCYVGFTTTPWWRTSSAQQRTVGRPLNSSSLVLCGPGVAPKLECVVVSSMKVFLSFTSV